MLHLVVQHSTRNQVGLPQVRADLPEGLPVVLVSFFRKAFGPLVEPFRNHEVVAVKVATLADEDVLYSIGLPSREPLFIEVEQLFI